VVLAIPDLAEIFICPVNKPFDEGRGKVVLICRCSLHFTVVAGTLSAKFVSTPVFCNIPFLW
jgi:hypothetical protein